MAHAHYDRKLAFTLVEILAVLAIMTIIAGLLLAASMGARRRADSDAAQAGVDFISSQIEAYYNRRGQLPPDLNEDGITTEAEIYHTLDEWNFPVPPARRVDPWGNPFVIVLQRDYGEVFPIVTGGPDGDYNRAPFNRIREMYGATADMPKDLYRGDPTNPFNDSVLNFQVISAGPSGRIVRDVEDDPYDYSTDNFVNW